MNIKYYNTRFDNCLFNQDNSNRLYSKDNGYIYISESSYKGPCIYCIQMFPSGRVYIGQTMSFYDRSLWHKSRLLVGAHNNKILQGSFDRNRCAIISILEKCTIESLSGLEVQYTNSFNSVESGCNIVNPNDNQYYKISDERRKRLSKGSTGSKNPSSKPVYEYDKEGKYLRGWKCAMNAVRFYKGRRTGVSEACTGAQKAYLGKQWRHYKVLRIEPLVYKINIK